MENPQLPRPTAIVYQRNRAGKNTSDTGHFHKA